MLTLLAFTVLIAAVVRIVHGTTVRNGGAQGSGEAEADRLGRIVQAQDQTPRSVPLRRAAAPRHALEAVIAADMRQRIRRHEFRGPLQSSRCKQVATSRRNRRAYRCTAQAAGLPYPFLGVVDLRRRRVTWCKYDPGATPTSDVPVSPSCRA